MNNMQIESKIKDHFKSVSLPKIDVTQKVMDKIINPQPKINIFKNKKFAIILLAAIFITTTGFAVSKLITMKDSDGNVLWTYNEGTDEYERLKKLTDEKRAEINLQSGEAVLIFVNKDNPTKFMSIFMEPIVTTNFSDIENNMFTNFNLPKVFLEKYEFTTGQIQMEPKDVDNQEIIKEANNTTTKDNPVFVKYLDLSDKVTNICGTYSDGTNSIKINISEWHGNDVYSSYSKDSSKKQKIYVENYQVLYEENDESNRVFWIKDEVYYNITSPSEEASMDDLIKAAKTLINLNK
ncbi:hypothetical protein [Oceanirhabdus sp. W0125-5]|uniref:hypothetical protein n=1 Tax=Oceanirhabdus sp. W0125-5 TaxID=2999116 RepID=UPI0022F308F0|nr:hypothetical protein [Oceanirhabdus sp. W0125-5]WBW98111.1 hypothetical protein OW730_04925 [Oceanirhabdus sp. W0125-5]